MNNNYRKFRSLDFILVLCKRIKIKSNKMDQWSKVFGIGSDYNRNGEVDGTVS